MKAPRALAWLESGRLADAAEAEARRLGFGQHFVAVDHLRALAGHALEQRDLDTAEQLADQALSIAVQRSSFALLTLLDRAKIRAVCGQIHDALAADGRRASRAPANVSDRG